MTPSSTAPAARRGRIRHRLALAVLATAIAACGHEPNYDDRTTGAVPLDYRERHPIVITDETRVHDVPVGQGDTRLPEGTRETVLGFLARYRTESEGVIQISRPKGSANAATAAHAAREIAELFDLAGVGRGRIVNSSYDVPGDAVAPVRIAYSAVRSTVAECGTWPEDVLSPSTNHDNRPYHNFGCASQKNLAAQIANPTDLLHPREPTSVDPQRRNVVIEDFRENGNGVITAPQGF